VTWTNVLGPIAAAGVLERRAGAAVSTNRRPCRARPSAMPRPMPRPARFDDANLAGEVEVVVPRGSPVGSVAVDFLREAPAMHLGWAVIDSEATHLVEDSRHKRFACHPWPPST